MKNSKQKTIVVLTCALAISAFLISCATGMEEILTNKLEPYQHYGYIINESGQKINGLIELNAFGNIWMNQGTIGFFPQTSINKAKQKGKKSIRATWYKSSELKGYGYENKKFVTKQVNLNIGRRYRMLEVLSENDKTYKFYSSENGPSDPAVYNILREKPNGELEWIK